MEIYGLWVEEEREKTAYFDNAQHKSLKEEREKSEKFKEINNIQQSRYLIIQ